MAYLTPTFATKTAEGKKLLVPYLMAGMDNDWLEVLDAVIDGGADGVEIGLPFSDPVLDGVTIQEAGMKSLENGTTARSIFAALAKHEVGVPLVAMTYYNVIAHMGHERFAGEAREAGISGSIVPDLPLEELNGWYETATKTGIDSVLLVAPSTSPERTELLCQKTQGFVYAVAQMGVTGERSELGADVSAVVSKIRAFPSPPICVGIGVSTPDQAVEVAREADGVIVGSALIRTLLDGHGPEGARSFVASLRNALDR